MGAWSFRKKFVVGLIIVLVGIFSYRSFKEYKEAKETNNFSHNEILHLEIKGVIMNGKKFLAQLKKYKKNSSVKAVVIDINSPGGAVGPSQEIYTEILRMKNETKKPFVCVSTGLMASGGYYSALGCDKIVVAPGAMIGSIGVIMEFANLEKLYDWAKIQRYTITSGKYKDSGSEYRAMRDDERALFQDMINDVYNQFAETVAASRNLNIEVVKQYADGRVMTGNQAVKVKLADEVGTFEDAVRLAANMAKLGEDYKVMKPKKDKVSFIDYITMEDDEDDLNSLEDTQTLIQGLKSNFDAKIVTSGLVKDFLKMKYLNQPMYLMPGYWE